MTEETITSRFSDDWVYFQPSLKRLGFFFNRVPVPKGPGEIQDTADAVEYLHKP